jgi:hypothetical protein
LVINPIVYAECSVGYDRIEEVEVLFEHLGFIMKPIPREVLFLAGKAFLQYRKRQGQKAMCCRISSSAPMRRCRLISSSPETGGALAPIFRVLS